jgi:uncharacterized integral membrane protein
MKIFLNFLKILIFILTLYLLSQNSREFVSISLFRNTYPNVSLMTVIIITLTVGAVIGGIFMAFSAIQQQSEIRQLRQRNRQLLTELESLRNVSIDEIPDDDIPRLVAPDSVSENQITRGEANG